MPSGFLLSCLGLVSTLPGNQIVLCDIRDQRWRGRKQQGKDRTQQAYLESASLGEAAWPSVCEQCFPYSLELCAAAHIQSSL